MGNTGRRNSNSLLRLAQRSAPRKSGMKRVLIGIALVTSLSPAVLFGQSGPSKTPSCAKACDLIDCVKNTIQQKRQIIQVYEALATKWMKIWMNADVNPKTPLYVVARTSLDVDTRIHLLEQLKY